MSLEKRSVKNFEIKIKFESRAWTFQEKNWQDNKNVIRLNKIKFQEEPDE